MGSRKSGAVMRQREVVELGEVVGVADDLLIQSVEFWETEEVWGEPQGMC